MSKTKKEVEITKHEEEFCKYKLNIQGSFKKHLYDLMFYADDENKKKLINLYPELGIMKRYQHEGRYWINLVRRWNLKHPTMKLLY